MMVLMKKQHDVLTSFELFLDDLDVCSIFSNNDGACLPDAIYELRNDDDDDDDDEVD